jgi:hypothetical protein
MRKISLIMVVLIGYVGRAEADSFSIKLNNAYPLPTCSSGPYPNASHPTSFVTGCSSTAYVLNKTSSEFYFCESQLSVTVQISTNAVTGETWSAQCAKYPAVFSANSTYSFDGNGYTEIAGPKTSNLGHSVWVIDDNALNVSSCYLVMPEGTSVYIFRCKEPTIN